MLLVLLVTPVVIFADNHTDTDQAADDPVTVVDEADSGGLVTCTGPDCDLCSFVSMIDGIIDWLIGIMVVVFAIITAYAGFLLVVSGGNVEARKKARTLITNSIVGIIIVLAAWILIDTLLRVLLPGDTGDIDGFGPWNEVKCNSQFETSNSGSPFATTPGSPDGDYTDNERGSGANSTSDEGSPDGNNSDANERGSGAENTSDAGSPDGSNGGRTRGNP